MDNSSKYDALSSKCKVVFEVLKKLAKDQLANGIFYASYPEIGKRSGYGRTAIFAAIKELNAIGLIVKFPNHQGGKNGYQFTDESHS